MRRCGWRTWTNGIRAARLDPQTVPYSQGIPQTLQGPRPSDADERRQPARGHLQAAQRHDRRHADRADHGQLLRHLGDHRVRAACARALRPIWRAADHRRGEDRLPRRPRAACSRCMASRPTSALSPRRWPMAIRSPRWPAARTSCAPSAMAARPMAAPTRRIRCRWPRPRSASKFSTRRRPLQTLAAYGETLKAGIKEILDARGIVHSFSGHSSMFGLFFAPSAARQLSRLEALRLHLLRRAWPITCTISASSASPIRASRGSCAKRMTSSCLADTLRAFETAVDLTLEQVEAREERMTAVP